MSPTTKRVAVAVMLAHGGATAADHPRHDFPERIIQSTTAREGDDAESLAEDYARRLLLREPDSPYSALRDVGEITANSGWHEALDESGLAPADGVKAYAFRMGLTKARPAVDLEISSQYLGYDPFIGASATKAAVDEDIFRHAIEYSGFHNAAIAANYAVGAQMLRDSLKRVPAERHEEQNLRKDVLDRFLAMGASDVIDDYDGDYLERLVAGEITDFRPGVSPSLAVDYLPAQYRVARLAAAYHDMSGYFGGFPCLRTGVHNPAFAGTGTENDTRALCFVDANDQDVYTWYLRQLKAQMEGLQRYPDQPKESALVRLLKPIAVLSEVAGIASFINFTTGLRALGKGWVRPGSVKTSYRRLSMQFCKKAGGA